MFTIHSIEWHQKQLLTCDNKSAGYHKLAIQLLEQGVRAGIDGPAVMVTSLRKKGRQTPVDAQQGTNNNKPVWILSDQEAKRYKRKYVTIREATLNSLGMYTVSDLIPCSRVIRMEFDKEGNPSAFIPVIDAKKGV